MSDHSSENSRRSFLRKSLTLIPAVTLASYGMRSMTAHAAEQSAYQPRFFNAAEWAFINAAVARLIPADDNGPGAVEAGVPGFIDGQMETPYGHGLLWYMQPPFHPEAAAEFGYQSRLVPRDIYRIGIRAINDWCSNEHGKRFAELEVASQVSVLEQMEQNRIALDEIPVNLLFRQLLQNTREGFFSDPRHGGNKGLVGWKLVGFPGARADFMDWADRGEKYPFPPVAISGERG